MFSPVRWYSRSSRICAYQSPHLGFACAIGADVQISRDAGNAVSAVAANSYCDEMDHHEWAVMFARVGLAENMRRSSTVWASLSWR